MNHLQNFYILFLPALEEDDLDRYNLNPIITTQTTIGGYNRSFIGKFKSIADLSVVRKVSQTNFVFLICSFCRKYI